MIATEDVDPSQAGTVFHPVVREFGTWKVLHSFQTAGSGLGVGFSPDSSRLVAGTVDGWLHVFDLALVQTGVNNEVGWALPN